MLTFWVIYSMILESRLATIDDIQAIKTLMSLSIEALLKKVLTPAQVAKSYTKMGLDTQLIEDGTYYVILDRGQLVGCGGWSRRKTLYGGNHTLGRDDAIADPNTEPAKIRAMYTHPDYVRRGIGRMVLQLGETAAKNKGYKTVELGATASGILLYEKSGYKLIGDLTETDQDGVSVPIFLMRKVL